MEGKQLNLITQHVAGLNSYKWSPKHGDKKNPLQHLKRNHSLKIYPLFTKITVKWNVKTRCNKNFLHKTSINNSKRKTLLPFQNCCSVLTIQVPCHPNAFKTKVLQRGKQCYGHTTYILTCPLMVLNTHIPWIWITTISICFYYNNITFQTTHSMEHNPPSEANIHSSSQIPSFLWNTYVHHHPC